MHFLRQAAQCRHFEFADKIYVFLKKLKKCKILISFEKNSLLSPRADDFKKTRNSFFTKWLSPRGSSTVILTKISRKSHFLKNQKTKKWQKLHFDSSECKFALVKNVFFLLPPEPIFWKSRFLERALLKNPRGFGCAIFQSMEFRLFTDRTVVILRFAVPRFFRSISKTRFPRGFGCVLKKLFFEPPKKTPKIGSGP